MKYMFLLVGCSVITALVQAAPDQNSTPHKKAEVHHQKANTAANDITWSSANNVYGGSITFVHHINGQFYFGTARGKLYSGTEFNKPKRVVSPEAINGIQDLLFHNNTFFIGTAMGLYTSTDNCKTWTQAKTLSDSSIYQIIEHKGTLFATTSRGLATSQDNGSSWRLTPIIPSQRAYSRFIISNGDVLVAAPETGTTSHFYYSSDNGKTWSELDESIYFLQGGVRPFTVIDDTIYLVALDYRDHSPTHHQNNPGDYAALLSSTDGQHWQKVSSITELGTFPNIAYVAHDSKDQLYIAHNPFESLSELQQPTLVSGNIHQTDWNIIYQSQSDYHDISSLSILNEQPVFGIGLLGTLLTYDPNTKKVGTLGTVTSAHINTVSPFHNGLITSISGAMPTPPQDSFWALNCQSQVFLKQDNKDWTPTRIHPDANEVISTYSSPDNTLSLAITCDSQIFYSKDNSTTFKKVTGDDAIENSTGSTITLFNNKVYAATRWAIHELSDFDSDNPSYTTVYTFDDYQDVLNQLLSTPHTLYGVSMTKGVMATQNGQQWSYINQGLNHPSDIQTLTSNNDTVFGAGAGVFRRSSEDSQWQDISGNFTEIVGHKIARSITLHQESLLIAVPGHGILMGSANGKNWSSVNTGLSTLNVTNILSLANGEIILGTEDNGLYTGHLTSNGHKDSSHPTLHLKKL